MALPALSEPMLKAPIDSASALLDWIVKRPVQEFFDRANRPLGESRAASIASVKTERQACPYAGGRYHHAKPMNVTALRQLPSWHDLLTMLSWLACRFRTEFDTRVETYNDLAQVTSSGVFLADYLALRNNEPVQSGRVPTLFSGLYKVCLGFQLAYMIERYSIDDGGSRLPDPPGFLEYLEASQLLIGDAEVCSGTPAMITQAYAAIIEDRSPAQADLPAGCDDMGIDWRQFDAFAYNAAMLWNDLVVFSLAAPSLFPNLPTTDVSPAVSEAVNRRLAQRGAEIITGQTGFVSEIAKTVRLWSGLPPRHWAPHGLGSGDTGDGTALATVLANWLEKSAPDEFDHFRPAIVDALRPGLARYASYERVTLARLSSRVAAMARALGWSRPVMPLTAVDLSRVLGGTLWDWDPTPT